MTWLKCLMAAVIMSAAVPARAEGNARVILEQLNSAGAQDIGRMAIHMAFVGMLWSNVHLSNQGLPQSFCLPGKLAMEPEQVESVFRQVLIHRPDLIDKPAGMVLLMGMLETFPCG